jgi:hypothetical protein
LVLAGCSGTDVGADDNAGKDSAGQPTPVSQLEWRLTDPPTTFADKRVARLFGSAYAAGDVVFATGLDGFTMHDGRTGKLLWDHGQDIDDQPVLDIHDFRLVSGSGPLYVDGAGATVYASTWTHDDDLEKRHWLTAFDGVTGKVKSNQPITLANGSAQVVAVAGDIILLADGSLYDDHTVGSDFVLRGIGRTSGKQVWERDGFAPVGISGTTLVGHQDRDIVRAGKVAAIDVTTGKDMWTAPAPAQAADTSDEVRVPYVGGQSVVVVVEPFGAGDPKTAILDVASGKVVATHPIAVDECEGQATTIAACSTSTEPPFFFDPATGKPVQPLVKTKGAKVTALTDDACYVEDGDVGQVLAVGSGEQLADGQPVLPVQLGNGYGLTRGGNYWDVHPGR